MFKNMKRLATLSLPLVALSLASCNSAPRYVTYDKMRRFVAETYDKYALDAVPATFTTNLNKVEANIVVDYETPEGGKDSLVFSFGFGNVHVVVKDRYAYCLSSTLIDMIEQYYSDFAGIALSFQDEPPLQMNYELFGDNCSKVELTASQNLVGSVLVKLLQLGSSVLDLASSYAGYIPTNGDVGGTSTAAVVAKAVQTLIQGFFSLPFFEDMSDSMIKRYANITRTVIFALMDYAKFTVSNSSKSNGEVFDSYITTDKYGLIDNFVFNFKSDFVITGLTQFKKYESDTPQPGDKPVTEAPYQFTMTGSFDIDIDIESRY